MARLIRYGWYKDGGKLKYRPLPKELLKKKRRKYVKKVTTDKCKQGEIIQAVEFTEIEPVDLLEDEDE